MDDVFRGSEALRQGKLTRYQLLRDFRPIYPDTYLPKCAAPSLRTRSVAAWLWSGRRGVLAGLAAAALHGSSWIDDDEPVEMVWRNPHPPAGVVTRSPRVNGDELAHVAGLPVTTPARTAFDLARQLPPDEAVARLDALKRATSFSTAEVLLLAKRYPGARGLRRLRSALPLIDAGAASPKETWLRLLLINARLPVPSTQIPVQENWRCIGVLDMGWEKYKVAVEYDGDHHRSDRRQYARDQWRLRKLEELGWIIVRVIAEDKPDDVVRRVRAALHRRGYRDI
ncbi:endonuclease domain-containing protein [Mycobacterium sp.]|uniref:endonuclease domain-containing protein n=1 Tax=Mycobacterium sp. TaxID=1785 RepID=UPI003F95F74B